MWKSSRTVCSNAGEMLSALALPFTSALRRRENLAWTAGSWMVRIEERIAAIKSSGAQVAFVYFCNVGTTRTQLLWAKAFGEGFFDGLKKRPNEQ